METGCADITETAQLVQLLKINGFSTTATMTNLDYIESGWNVDGYEWEVRVYPSFVTGCAWVALKFIFLGEPRSPSAGVRTKIRCRLVDPSGDLEPSEEKSLCKEFLRSGGSAFFLLMKVRDVPASGYLKDDDSLTVECGITVLKELKRVTIRAKEEEEVALPVPPSDLYQHLGELLRSQKGVDVTFTVSGESFDAHKLVLAARSPVFMAEFFGAMEERSSRRVEIEDMEAVVFRAMLHYIYTDLVPELDEEPDEGAAATSTAIMAQHLLAAADRYGLERLKLICEGKLSGGIGVDTAATTLALAEQHNCSILKDKCIEFIARSPENLDAVLATDGYKHLVASCPLALTELLKAANGRKN